MYSWCTSPFNEASGFSFEHNHQTLNKLSSWIWQSTECFSRDENFTLAPTSCVHFEFHNVNSITVQDTSQLYGMNIFTTGIKKLQTKKLGMEMKTYTLNSWHEQSRELPQLGLGVLPGPAGASLDGSLCDCPPKAFSSVFLSFKQHERKNKSKLIGQFNNRSI